MSKIAFILVMLSMTMNLINAQSKGTYTFYTGPFDAGSCGYGKFVNNLKLNVVAVKTPGTGGGADAMLNGARCGQCVKVCVGGFCEVMHVVDACPSCDHHDHIDISSPIFEKLKQKNERNKNYIPGKGDMQMTWVDCTKELPGDLKIGSIKITVLQAGYDVFQFGIAADNGVFGASIADAKAGSGRQQGSDSVKLMRFNSQFYAFQLVQSSSTRLGDYDQITLNIECNGSIGGASKGKTVQVTIYRNQITAGNIIDTGKYC